MEQSDTPISSIHLRTWTENQHERLYPLESQGDGFYSITKAWDEPQIVWYSFVVTLTGGRVLRVGAQDGHEGGEAVTYDRLDVPSFQITVYKHRSTRPAWYEQGMVYQIFPDRYARDENWRKRTETALAVPRKGIPRRIVDDWNTPPRYDRNPDNSIASWDFYGGSLKGIQEDLPRIAELGFTSIYLNPIFEAQSSHRYDTADYLKIDPALGTERDFVELCKAAKKYGISIILDGVFNHTGDDSRYFNRYGNYPDVGAWQSEDSPWRSAYCFHEDGTYDSWWGIGNMPALNEDSDLVQNRLLGEDGVIRHWLAAGAHGWRLDVADELTDDMIEKIKRATVAEKPDGLVIGEVWEDASNKVAYGKLRSYLLGSELDSAMNYPFRDMVLSLLMGWGSAYDTADAIETLSENYPKEALHCALNLLGSHDRPRIISVLGGAPLDDSIPEDERSTYRLSSSALDMAKKRFWLATLMQMTFPGVPSVYYGDEFGVQGLTDPGNRSTLPETGNRDLDFETMIKNASAIRRELPFMVTGDIRAFALNDDVLAYNRNDAESDESATVLINRSGNVTHTATIDALGPCATDIISGKVLPISDGKVSVTLYPHGSAVVYFHKDQRLQQPLDAGVGVLCHITSVPSSEKGAFGTLGADTKRFIDHLSDMGMRYWQLLPVNPTDKHRSPYSGPSAFAGNIELLSQTEQELRASFKTWSDQGDEFSDPAYERFMAENGDWLDPYCAFMAIKKLTKGASRHAWDDEFQAYSPELLEDPRLVDEASFVAYAQYRFEKSWNELRDYAHSKNISIIGDIPMYVSDDSSDAWAHPELFWLSDTGKALEISGAPPDNLAPEGQVWGNPTFKWQKMKETGYAWWIARLKRAFALYDDVRLDHFLGFNAYYSIPAGKPCSCGRWVPGPGFDLFKTAYDELGPLPLVAEDLGCLSAGAAALIARCGIPGMDVVQFENYDVLQGFKPQASKVVYASTHDTQTLVGYFQTRQGITGDSTPSEDQQRQAINDAEKVAREVLSCDVPVVMFELQDVLELDDRARMNVPGVAEGNWSWQAKEPDVEKAVPRIAQLLKETNRFNA